MIFVYFDKYGTIKEIINDNSTRVGNSYSDKIYFYFDETENIENIFCIIKRADGSLSNEISILENVEYKEIPYDKKRDLKFFEDFKKYKFYYYQLTTSDTIESGLCSSTVRVLIDGVVYAKGMLTFNVEENIIKEDYNIGQSQYDYLLEKVGGFEGKIEKLKTIYINYLSELDSYTTPGIYKFNINNTNTFHLFVIKISDSLIGQTRSSRKGFYYRIINSGVASEWNYGSYNVNGITEYGSTISYNKGAIVNYLGDLYLSLIDENTTPLNEAWSKLEFTKFVKLEELDNYVLKEEGKGLSSNDYTNEEKAKVSKSVAEDDLKTINGESIIGKGNIDVKAEVNLDSLDARYVQKEEGKGLSTNDLTNALLAKLNSLKNYDDTALNNKITAIERILVSDNVDLDTLQEIVDVLEENEGDINAIFTAIAKKVDKDGLKTINGESIVGSGNIEVKGGSGNAIDLGEVVLEEMHNFPDGLTYDDFKNANSVMILDNNGEAKYLANCGGITQDGSTGVLFYNYYESGTYLVSVVKEINQYIVVKALGWRVKEFDYWNRDHSINVKGTTNEGEYNYSLKNLRIKLNGINHDTFTEDGANRELDLDAAINNKIAAAIGNALEADY